MRRETITNPDSATFESMENTSEAREELEKYREWLRNLLRRRNLKTDQDFKIDYKKNFKGCLWSDRIIRERNNETEPMTQPYSAYTLIRSINFILENFSDIEIQAIKLYAMAEREFFMVTYNRELTAGKRVIEAARQAGESQAPIRSISQRHWQELARTIATEIRTKHPDWTQMNVAIEVGNRLSKKRNIHLKPDTIYRALRR
ncbi:MAG: hypothetical protein JNM13_11100 [Hyphomicrobiaceae bacterium]|nr:hypothetical protein [Hyphomicrobiaceae bacterium]